MQPRVLLIYPPSRMQSHDTCPASLTMLGAVLEEAGYRVTLLDANATSSRRTPQQIVRFASDLKPDVIGITLLTPLVREAYRLATSLRSTGAKLLAGGPHATILPEEPLAHASMPRSWAKENQQSRRRSARCSVESPRRAWQGGRTVTRQADRAVRRCAHRSPIWTHFLRAPGIWWTPQTMVASGTVCFTAPCSPRGDARPSVRTAREAFSGDSFGSAPQKAYSTRWPPSMTAMPRPISISWMMR